MSTFIITISLQSLPDVLDCARLDAEMDNAGFLKIKKIITGKAEFASSYTLEVDLNTTEVARLATEAVTRAGGKFNVEVTKSYNIGEWNNSITIKKPLKHRFLAHNFFNLYL